MKLALEPLPVQYHHVLLVGDQPLLDVERDFQVDGGVLDVVVEVDESAGVDLEVRVGRLELVVGEVGELVLYELDALLDPVEVQRELLLLLALLQELQAGVEGIRPHLAEHLVVGLPRVQVEVLIDLLLQSDLVGDDELFFRDLLVGGDVLLGHEVEEEVLGVELLVQVLLDELVPAVLEVVQQLDPVALKVQPQPLPHQLVQLLVYPHLLDLQVQHVLRPLAEDGVPLLQDFQPIRVPVHRNSQLMEGPEEVLDRVVVANEQGLVELLVEVADEVLPADGRDFEREALQLQSHVVDLLHRLGSVDEVFYLVRDLQGAVELLPVHGQLDIAGQHSVETDCHGLLGSQRHVLEGMSHEALLLKLLDQG